MNWCSHLIGWVVACVDRRSPGFVVLAVLRAKLAAFRERAPSFVKALRNYQATDKLCFVCVMYGEMVCGGL